MTKRWHPQGKDKPLSKRPVAKRAEKKDELPDYFKEFLDEE